MIAVLTRVQQAIATIRTGPSKFGMVYVKMADGTERFFPGDSSWAYEAGCIKIKTAEGGVLVRFMPGQVLEIWRSYRNKLESDLASTL